MIAGMQLLGEVLRTSFNYTVAQRYSLNRRYLPSPVLSTDRLSTLGWTLSLTFTVRSRIWMCPLLLPSLAIRPWSQQPAQNQDLEPKEQKRTNLTDIHASTSFLSSSRPQDLRDCLRLMSYTVVGRRFALYIFIISKQYSPTPNHETLPLEAEFAPL